MQEKIEKWRQEILPEYCPSCDTPCCAQNYGGLSDEQVNALTQWVTKIDSMLVDPVMMADGGRVDKALGGRVRDI